ncbi:bromodomain associated domain, Histone-fold protein [Artemisia annua]|uniref:Bromodomain associated domain, Histone-fold protein n=1 Tax=Artemisia annua TaxID=35608 RepID=A0A2U1PKS0_ARTAN|nr:bromodomain associated domain, Histone-fold protein [Artemisia annua]
MKKKKNKTKPSSSSSNQINGSDSSTFHVSIATTAVAQICHSVGYKATQTTALQTLTNVTVRYLTSLATSAASSAVSTGRTECNLYDVIRALDDVHDDVIGFKGNSDVTRRLSSLKDSEMLKDVMRFVHWSREIPFAKPLPRGRQADFPKESYCGEKEVFTVVNEGEKEMKKRVTRGKQMVTSLYGESNVNEELNHFAQKNYCGEKEMLTSLYGESNGNEKLNHFAQKNYCGEKEVFTVVNEGKSEGEKEKVPRGRQMVTSLYGENNGIEKLDHVAKKSYCGEKEILTAVNEGEKEKKVPRGREMVASPYGEMSHVPKWLPEIPKKSECGEKVVFTEVNEGKNENEKVKVSELPVVRKKVRFEIGGKSGRGKEVINLNFGVDLRSGVCKGGKRILCQIYEEEDGKKKYVNDGGKKNRKR